MRSRYLPWYAAPQISIPYKNRDIIKRSNSLVLYIRLEFLFQGCFIHLAQRAIWISQCPWSSTRGWARTSLVWKFLYSATTIICANNLSPALRTTSWLLQVLTFTFLLRSVKVLSLAFFMVLWNLTSGGSHWTRCSQKALYTSSPTSFARSRSSCTSEGATFPVDSQTRSWSDRILK